MPTLVEAAALAFAFETLSGQSDALDPGSLMIAAAAWTNFGGTPTITALKRGGSGGTDITPASADQAFFFGDNALARGGYALPSGAGAETIYSSATGALQGCVGGAIYSDVASVHDWTTNEGVDGSGTTTVASVSVPNCIALEKCAGVAICVSDSINMTTFTPVTGTTITAQHFRVGEGFIAVAVLEKEVIADGACLLEVNCNTDSSAGMGWWIGGLAMVSAGGGGAVAGPLVNALRLKSKLKGLVQ